MGGFLNQIKRKTQKKQSIAADLLLQGKESSTSSGLLIQPATTDIVESSSSLGEVDALLAELQSEGKASKAGSPVVGSTHPKPPPAPMASTVSSQMSAPRSGTVRVVRRGSQPRQRRKMHSTTHFPGG